MAWAYDLVCMKKEQLARRLAKESHISQGAAADEVDRILNNLLQRVRKGQPASLPGLGTFRPGGDRDFQFEREVAPSSRAGKSKKASR